MAEMLRALTVKQPFAWAIAYGGKSPENRTKSLKYRGPLAIHSGLGVAEPGFFPTHTEAGRAAARAFTALGGRSNFWEPRSYIPSALRDPPHPGLALGAVIALTEVTGCHHADYCDHLCPDWDGLLCAEHEGVCPQRLLCSPWAISGQWHITLANVRPLPEPIPCRGALGLWRLLLDVEAQARKQLEASHA